MSAPHSTSNPEKIQMPITTPGSGTFCAIRRRNDEDAGADDRADEQRGAVEESQLARELGRTAHSGSLAAARVVTPLRFEVTDSLSPGFTPSGTAADDLVLMEQFLCELLQGLDVRVRHHLVVTSAGFLRAVAEHEREIGRRICQLGVGELRLFGGDAGA